ncbi:MAG: T9SS type A sorting domain-containing protein [Fibrobacter sp.]|nr:T9SS type A sorting domain-containing protein [Fibrobacter sp.]
MGLLKKKHIISGLAASLLIMSSGLFAQDALFDDHSDGTNQNEFEYYWYYYDDNAGVKEDDRPRAGAGTTPSVVNVDYTEEPRHAFGDETDNHIVKKYVFTVGEEADNSYATMPFTFGEKWEASWCKTEPCAWPYVGMGSMLCKEGDTLDLNTATGVRFRIRSKTSELQVRFKVETMDIIEDSSYGYYQTMVTASPGEWTPYEIAFADMAQPDWAEKDAPFDFNLDLSAKLAWEVSGEDNTTIEEDCLDIDDIYVMNYTYVSRFMWTQETPPARPGNQSKLSDFDGAVPQQIKLPYEGELDKMTQYWYAYNDVEIGGNSAVMSGAVENEETGRLDIVFEDGTGSEGKGAQLLFQLGAPIPQDTIQILGFVGIGCNLYDSATCKYFNGTQAGANSVYFEYKADGDMKKATVELYDVNDVGDADNPDRSESRGSGVVMFRDLPLTGDSWVAVQIPFSEFLYHDDWESSVGIDLDITKLAKLQIKVQGAEGVAGVLAVDNVYFPDGAITHTIMRPINRSEKATFNANYSNGKINISFNNSELSNGKISLINTKGAVVKSVPVSNAKSLSTTLSTDNISNGMYIVRFNAKGLNGKSIVRQSKINIVK